MAEHVPALRMADPVTRRELIALIVIGIIADALLLAHLVRTWTA